jgi:hypothetical protein
VGIGGISKVAFSCSAVDRDHADAEQIGDLSSPPAEDIAQDQHRALSAGQLLHRGDQGKPQA